MSAPSNVVTTSTALAVVATVASACIAYVQPTGTAIVSPVVRILARDPSCASHPSESASHLGGGGGAAEAPRPRAGEGGGGGGGGGWLQAADSEATAAKARAFRITPPWKHTNGRKGTIAARPRSSTARPTRMAR